MSKIFRKIALERLSSPEQLDKLVTITKPTGWLALVAIGLLIVTTLSWGIYGKIPTNVTGGGILIKTGGVVNLIAPVQGQIDSLYPREGDPVRKGQIVARIAQPELLDEIRNARQALQEAEDLAEQLARFGSEAYLLQMKTLEKEKENLTQEIHASQERIKWLSEKKKVQEELLSEGLITRQTLIETATELENKRLKIEETRAEIRKVDAGEQELASEREQQVLRSDEKVSQARRELEFKEARLAFSTRVVSAYTGIVVELRSYAGQVIKPGDPLLSLEQTGDNIQDLQALIYMPPEQGKQIEPGMIMNITPQTVKREEYGTMLGMVTKVADFPSSERGMIRHLKNEALVTQFSQNGAPIAVFADLIPAPETVSGYKWSSAKGPPRKIFSGTFCQGSVEVRSQPPISLVVPILKKKTGLD